MRLLVALNFFLLWTLCGASKSKASETLSRRVRLGETVVLSCLCSRSNPTVWHKVTSSRRLEQLVSENCSSTESSQTSGTLKISNVTWEDAGTYYCGMKTGQKVTYKSGITVRIEGDQRPLQSVRQSPDSIGARPGDSVTLSCSSKISHCHKNHTSLMWVTSASNSEQVSGNTTYTCETSDDPTETTCVQTLTLKDISSTDAGMYLCVVTACGDTLMGKGSRIELHGHLVSISVISNIVLGVIVLVLVGLICVIYKRQTSDMDPSIHPSPEDNQVEDRITYAPVNIQPRSAASAHTFARNQPDSVVYSTVRVHRMK